MAISIYNPARRPGRIELRRLLGVRPSYLPTIVMLQSSLRSDLIVLRSMSRLSPDAVNDGNPGD